MPKIINGEGSLPVRSLIVGSLKDKPRSGGATGLSVPTSQGAEMPAPQGTNGWVSASFLSGVSAAFAADRSAALLPYCCPAFCLAPDRRCHPSRRTWTCRYRCASLVTCQSCCADPRSALSSWPRDHRSPLLVRSERRLIAPRHRQSKGRSGLLLSTGLFSRRTSRVVALNRRLCRPFLSSRLLLFAAFFSTRTPLYFFGSLLALRGLFDAYELAGSLVALARAAPRCPRGPTLESRSAPRAPFEQEAFLGRSFSLMSAPFGAPAQLHQRDD